MPMRPRPSVGQRRNWCPRATQVRSSEPVSMTTTRDDETAAQTKKSIGIGVSWGSSGATHMKFSTRRRRGFVPYRMAYNSYTSSLIAGRLWFPGVAEVDPHALGLQVLADGIDTALPAEARGLVAAERRLRRGVAVAVHPYRPCLQPAADPVGPAEVARPHAGGETVGDSIGERYRLRFAVERGHGQDRTEHFLLEQLAGGVDV